jgi:hypothetical protein
LFSRACLGIGGIALATPGNDVIHMSNAELAGVAAVLVVIGTATGFVDHRQLVASGAD